MEIDAQLDYRRLLPVCIPRMLKRDLKEATLAVGIATDAKMSAAELKDFVVKNATPEQAQKLRELYPGYFGLSCRDAKDAFNISLTTGQAEYLARHGRLAIVDHFISPYTGFECDLYSPESLAALGKEDLTCPDSPNWVNQSVLIQQFGWTRTMISKFLPAPKLETNPRYRSAPDMKLWRIEDVEAAMARDDFKEATEKAKARKATGRKGAETKRQKLEAEVDKKIKNIRVMSMDEKSLRGSALAAKQRWYDYVAAERGGDPFDSVAADADEETIRRWIVNYIRHELTDYDYDLCHTKGRTGCHEQYGRYRDAVLDKIAEAYPNYAEECQRQKERAWQ
jgi:hypothetical protein